jgi:DNA repair protein RadD
MEMVELGYLCPLVGVETEIQLDLSGVEKSGGDYVQKQVGDRETEEWLAAVVKSVHHLAKNRKHVAVYCPTVESANLTSEAFNKSGWSSSVVVGGTKNREEIIGEWKAGETRVICSVDVLTTGFDHPALDCIVVLRPTESSSLWVQIMGRGTRIHEGKDNCLILDYVGNLGRLGGIGMMEDFVVERGGNVESVRKATGRAPRAEKKKPNKLENLDPMSGKAGDINVYVNDVSYIVIGSKSQPGKQMVMVVYECQTEEGYTLSVNDFVLCEYSGYARQKAEGWVRRRGGTFLPYTAENAVHLCYALPTPRGLKVSRNGKYWNVTKEYF